MKTILTGGAGFIGSHICRELLENGHKVLIIDDLSTGKEENIAPEAEFEKCDIRDAGALNKIFSSFKPDIINHHAAQIDVRVSAEDPAHDADINIAGSLNLLNLCAEHGVKKFVFASTCAVYGHASKLPTDEQTPQNPESPYGIAKLCVENYLRFFKSARGIDFASLRYSNVYGERQRIEKMTGIVAILCGNHKKGAKTTIFGDGEQTRDYVHCSDVAKANSICSEHLGAGGAGGIFNICTGKENSLNRIIDLLAEVSGKEVKTEKAARKSGDVDRIFLDNSLAGETLDWKPLISLKEGIEKTWKWARGN
ncbi:MAG: NAD-dependent epimerase/dehydratase family protein [Candidatus Mycalebacterium zealandia]|nr:MAG: NAD-dependent epimerase/dehydratase family protein [Candidatus Mycalebacterium zealandia]